MCNLEVKHFEINNRNKNRKWLYLSFNKCIYKGVKAPSTWNYDHGQSAVSGNLIKHFSPP